MTKKRSDYLSWDECFTQMAILIAQRSKDPSTQAGAAIVDSDNIVVGLGYNGFPRGCADDALPWERTGAFLATKYAYVVHAEENAIYNANKPTKGCKLYSTLFPCNECVKTIIQTGIREVVYESDKYAETPMVKASKRMLKLLKIPIRQYKRKK